MTPAKANFTVKANGYWTKVWQLKNGGQPMDITGFDFELEIKKVRGAGGAKFLNLTVGDGITIINAADGKIQIEIPPQPSITTKQVYFYDLLMVINNKEVVPLEGEITFEPGVSYRDS